MPFVEVQGGSVSLASIVRIQNDSREGDKVVSTDGTTVEPARNIYDVISTLVVPQGDWECLVADAWEGDRLSRIIEPVLAWGITEGARLIPMTPFYPGGITDPYALRRAGSERVYSGDGSYPTEAEWLDMETRRAQRLGTGPTKLGRADGC